MLGKLFWSVILVLVIFTVLFFEGLHGEMLTLDAGYRCIAVAAITGSFLGVIGMVHFVRRKGIKGLFIGILIILILIPLVLLGNCVAWKAGDSERRDIKDGRD